VIAETFDYVRPASVDEAVALLAADAEALALAGGQSLVPLLRLRLARPTRLVDLSGLAELRGGDGALVTVAELRDGPLPILRDAAAVIADPLVRALGTVGGNLAHGDPRNDLPAVLAATRGHVVVAGPAGERTLTAAELWHGPFQTALAPGELVVRAVFPGSSAGAYEKLKRTAGDYGLAGVAVQLELRDDSVAAAGVAVTGMATIAERLPTVEQALVDGGGVEAAARLAGETCTPSGDGGRYVRALVAALARRALARALGRAGCASS
jgi:carbon-monoxide dehydrogenase medium subunit